MSKVLSFTKIGLSSMYTEIEGQFNITEVHAEINKSTRQYKNDPNYDFDPSKVESWNTGTFSLLRVLSAGTKISDILPEGLFLSNGKINPEATGNIRYTATMVNAQTNYRLKILFDYIVGSGDNKGIKVVLYKQATDFVTSNPTTQVATMNLYYDCYIALTDMTSYENGGVTYGLQPLFFLPVVGNRMIKTSKGAYTYDSTQIEVKTGGVWLVQEYGGTVSPQLSLSSAMNGYVYIVGMDGTGMPNMNLYSFFYSNSSGTSFNESGATAMYFFSLANANDLITDVPTYYSVIFNGNGNNSGTVPDTMTVPIVDDEATLTVPGNPGNLERLGWYFVGWQIDGVDYVEGEQVVIGENKIAYAVWTTTEPETFTLTFSAPDATSGTLPNPIQAVVVDDIAKVTLPSTDLKKENLNFGGWLVNGNVHQAGSVVLLTASTTATATWSSVSPDYPGDDTPSSGGGSGTFDDDSDSINIPANPTDILATNAGLSLFRLSPSALSDLSDYLFSANFMTWIKQTWSGNYKDLVTNLTWFPLTFTTGQEMDNATEIYLGPNASGVMGNPLLVQYMTLRYLPLDISPYWGNFLDYNPYTEMEIYLPFIGTEKIDVDLFMGNQIEVVYKIDLLTASGLCFVSAIADNTRHVLYTFPCSVGYQIPLGSDEYSRTKLKQGVIAGGAAVAVGAAIASSVAAPVTVGAATAGSAAAAATAAKVAKGAGIAAMSAATSNKSKFSQTGSLSDNVGALGTFVPYVTLTRPVQSIPQDYNKFYGYPSNTYQNISNLSGYTEIESIHLNGFIMTAEELAELENILNGGIIL